MNLEEKIVEQFTDSIIKEVDGYYYLSLNELKGEVDAYTLRTLANHIDKLNAEWDKKVREEFDGQ